MIRFLGILACLIGIMGCASQDRTPQPTADVPSSRRLWYKVEATAPGAWEKSKPVFIRAAPSGDTGIQESMEILTRALRLEGYQIADGEAPGGVVMTVSYLIEHPGVNMTILFAYKHFLELKVMAGGKTLWQGKAHTRSEYNSRGRTFPQLLAILRPYFGEASGGEQSITMAENDGKVMELIHAQ